jgi:hypothetical protein
MEPAEAKAATTDGAGKQPVPASTGQVAGVTAGNALDRVTNLEIEGVQVQGPKEGFGALWRKRYWVRLDGATASPAEIVREWRAHFGEFWPEGNTFYSPFGALDPGDIGLLKLEGPGGVRLASGVVVLNAGPEAFTLITPEGHMFAGVITFSAYRSGGTPVAQIEVVLRASDPLFEIGMILFGHRREDWFWRATLANLAAHFGASAEPEMHRQVLSRRYQWSNTGNLVSNSLLRGALFRSTAPITRLARRFRRQAQSPSSVKEQGDA